MIQIDIRNATVDFPTFPPDGGSFKAYWTRLVGAQKTRRTYVRALNQINLKIQEGERVGLIGSNGAGKTTLLKLASGIYPPQVGSVEVSGRLSPLLDLSVGFDPDLSGRENIRLRLMFLGYDQQKINEMQDEIIEFTQLNHFIDLPVKTYSSGMFLRLAFAASTCIEPEILVLDEFLSAGDLAFVRRAEERMDQLMRAGKIVLIASHAIEAVRERCTRAIWMQRGGIAMDGDPNEVVDAYIDYSRSAAA